MSKNKIDHYLTYLYSLCDFLSGNKVPLKTITKILYDVIKCFVFSDVIQNDDVDLATCETSCKYENGKKSKNILVTSGLPFGI